MRTLILMLVLWVLAMLVLGIGTAFSRDNGRFAGADPEIKAWFDHLASGKGLCCSFADGETVSDPDWDVKDGHYRVRLDGNWIDVPEDAVITQPNRVGQTMVWPLRLHDAPVTIRCFMPGALT